MCIYHVSKVLFYDTDVPILMYWLPSLHSYLEADELGFSQSEQKEIALIWAERLLRELAKG